MREGKKKMLKMTSTATHSSLFRVEPMIIAFGGKKFSGKDSCMRAIRDYIESNQKQVYSGAIHVVQINFADKLREVCSDLFGMTFEQMTDPVLKETVLKTWPWQTPRHILQQFASEGIRGQWPDMWVRHWVMRSRLELILGNIVVATDMRFPNERKWIAQLALEENVPFAIINVERPSLDNQIDTHVSEMAAGRLDHHVEIINNGSIEDLKGKVPLAVAAALKHYRSDMREKENGNKKEKSHEADE